MTNLNRDIYPGDSWPYGDGNFITDPAMRVKSVKLSNTFPYQHKKIWNTPRNLISRQVERRHQTKHTSQSLTKDRSGMIHWDFQALVMMQCATYFPCSDKWTSDWPQNSKKVCVNDVLEYCKYSNISLNKCLNKYVAQKSNDCFKESLNVSRYFQISKYYSRISYHCIGATICTHHVVSVSSILNFSF